MNYQNTTRPRKAALAPITEDNLLARRLRLRLGLSAHLARLIADLAGFAGVGP